MQALAADRSTQTPAWLFQTWASFAIAAVTTAIGIAYLPVDRWMRAFLGMGLLFTIGSAFTLAKTLRDEHESRSLVSRVDEARVEKLLADHHPLK